MPFITKINFQDNRQHRLPTRQSNDLSGTTVFGVPFSAMTTGPDPSNSGITSTITNIPVTYSGNSGTTVVTFANPILDIAQNAFVIIPANSATTLESGILFEGDTSQTVDGNFSYLSYTGASVQLMITAMTETTPGIYTGSGESLTADILSAGTLDYTGRTIWNDTIGISRTEKLIVSDNPVVGYVLKSDAEGMATWQPDLSGGTALWTAGTGTAGSMVQFNSGGVSSGNLSVVGGSGNSSAGNLSVILGGFGHSITAGADIGAIMGGANHTINNAVDHSVAIGGVGNTVANSLSGIFVGQDNTLAGGADNWSAIMAGSGNTLTASRSTIIGGLGLVGTSDDTVYVPNFNINTVGSGTSINNLGIDVNGYVVTGTTGGGTFTGNTSGDCITDLYVSNIHSCSPLYINENIEGNIFFGALSANTFDLTNNRLGLGIVAYGTRTTDPIETLELGEGKWMGFNTNTTGAGVGGSAGLHFKEGIGGIAGYGADMYYQATTTTDRLIMTGKVGGNNTGGLMVQRNGRVGILGGTGTTAELISANFQIGTTAFPATFKFVSGSEGVGKVMTSDADGVVTWNPTLWTAGTGTDAVVQTNSGGDASGNLSVAEGTGTTASGHYSHAEGKTTSATTFYAHAEGWNTLAGGQSSHAEGEDTIASATYSHAQGQLTLANGHTSHAEGYGTKAGGARSHAQGYETETTGAASHAAGISTLAEGDASHAGGSGTTATGHYSLAYGVGNVVTGDRSVVLGGQDITGATNDMVYVPDLVIDGLVSTDPLATDANGKIIAGASDARLKQNITDLTGGLDKIQNLRGVSYEWTAESEMGEGIHYGLIAQEVREVIPDMVRTRAKGDGMLTLSYTEVVPWLIEAVKEMSSDEYVNTRLETQTIVAEDNNIELNFGGTHATSQGGGISIKDGVREGEDSFIKIDETGRWIVGPALTTAQLTLPEYTPTNSTDEIGGSGDVVWDDGYLYIKTNNGWRRTNLETF